MSILSFRNCLPVPIVTVSKASQMGTGSGAGAIPYIGDDGIGLSGAPSLYPVGFPLNVLLAMFYSKYSVLVGSMNETVDTIDSLFSSTTVSSFEIADNGQSMAATQSRGGGYTTDGGPDTAPSRVNFGTFQIGPNIPSQARLSAGIATLPILGLVDTWTATTTTLIPSGGQQTVETGYNENVLSWSLFSGAAIYSYNGLYYPELNISTDFGYQWNAQGAVGGYVADSDFIFRLSIGAYSQTIPMYQLPPVLGAESSSSASGSFDLTLYPFPS